MTNYSPLLSLFALAPRLRRASNRAVSIFLPARAEGYDARFYDIEFRDLLHRYQDRLSPKDRELMEYEMRRLRHHIAVVRPAGCPAFAGFADEPHGVLELIKLPGETDERLEVGELLLAPILRQLEHHPPALIAVVDKEHAKTFGSILDIVIPLEQVNGAEVRHTAFVQAPTGPISFSYPWINDARFVDRPGILETPKGDDEMEDRRNMATLRQLVAAAGSGGQAVT